MVSNQNLLVEMFLIRLIHLTSIPKLDDLINSFDEKEIKSEAIDNKNFDIDKKNSNQQESKISSKSLSQIKIVVQEKKKEDITNNKQPITSNAYLEIQNLKDLIMICSKKRELTLKYDLEKNVKLVKFSKGLIEIENSNDFDKDFIKNLSKKLFEWTNFRWIITLSQSKGDPTHSQVKAKQKKDELEIIKKSQEYKKMKDVFPDAELIQIKEEN